MSKKKTIFLIFIIIFSFISVLRAQISETEAKAEIILFGSSHNPDMTDSDWRFVEKMRSNPDIYLLVCQNNMILEKNIEFLANKDNTYYYVLYWSVIVWIGNSTSEILKEQKFQELLEVFEWIDDIDENMDDETYFSLTEDEQNQINQASVNMSSIVSDVVTSYQYAEDPSIIEFCLDRLKRDHGGLSFVIMDYLYEVAPGDPHVISSIEQTIADPNCFWHKSTKFKKYIDRLKVGFIASGLPVKLINSQNQLLPDGTLKYYQGGWKDAVRNGDGTFQVETDLETVKLRMTYAFASLDMDNVPVDGDTAVFQTVPAEVQLQNSLGELIDEGSVKYYSGGWRDLGVTSNGVAVKELLPKSYKFRMTYGFASNDLTQDIVADPVVTFQTVQTSVELRDSQNQLMDEGSVKYYSGGWRDLGVTSNGVAVKELLSNSYKFRMTYAFASNDLTQDIAADPVVTFQTVQTSVELRDSQNQLMDEGSVKYYSGGWRDLGVTSNGVAVRKLLPKSYKFKMTYGFASNDITQDISADPVVTFQSTLTEVHVSDAQNQPIDGAQIRYYSGGWCDFGMTVNGIATKELLPKSYNFRMTYDGTQEDRDQDISADRVVEFVVE